MIFTATLAVISGWVPRSHVDCTALSVSYGLVYFLHALNVAVRRPNSATWDYVAGIMSPILVCAAILVAQSGGALDVATCIIAVRAGVVTVVSVAVWRMKKFAPKEKDAIDEDAVEMDVKEEPLIEKAAKAPEIEKTAVPPSAVPAKAAPVPKKANPKAATVVYDFEL